MLIVEADSSHPQPKGRDQPGIARTGAGEGNRTLVVSLGSSCSTIELRPRRKGWVARPATRGQGVDRAGGGRARRRDRLTPRHAGGPRAWSGRPDTGGRLRTWLSPARRCFAASPPPEVLGQLQALALVVGAAFAVGAGGRFGHRLVDQPGDGLAVFQQERGLAAAHLQHRP